MKYTKSFALYKISRYTVPTCTYRLVTRSLVAIYFFAVIG